jgi:hypothetical protein
VGDRVFARAIEGKPAQVLGDPDVPHTVTYIEDFARALVTLGEREEALGQVWHVPNAETLTTRRFVTMVFEAAGHPARLRAAPRWGVALGALFNPTLGGRQQQVRAGLRLGRHALAGCCFSDRGLVPGASQDLIGAGSISEGASLAAHLPAHEVSTLRIRPMPKRLCSSRTHNPPQPMAACLGATGRPSCERSGSSV